VAYMKQLVHDGTRCSYKDAYSICVRGECVVRTRLSTIISCSKRAAGNHAHQDAAAPLNSESFEQIHSITQQDSKEHTQCRVYCDLILSTRSV